MAAVVAGLEEEDEETVATLFKKRKKLVSQWEMFLFSSVRCLALLFLVIAFVLFKLQGIFLVDMFAPFHG